MPNPSDFKNQNDFMTACVPMLVGEGKENDQAVAACISMWANKDKMPMKSAVKAVGDNILDVLAIPFNSKDSDGQWFDANTDIMPDAFQTPVAVYQHSVKQGAKGWEDKPIIIGKSIPGTLTKQADGWHIQVALDLINKLANGIMTAAKNAMVAVSSGTIDHLARLEIGGKLVPYSKDRPGRIAVWPLGEISMWEKGNGNFQPANRFAIAMPAMKAIYREAGIDFPEIGSGSQEARKAARRETVRKQSIEILNRIEKLKE